MEVQMTQAVINHCRIVQAALAGEQPPDEKTLASLAVLNQRLKRLKKHGRSFSQISFSPAAERLARQRHAVAVG